MRNEIESADVRCRRGRPKRIDAGLRINVWLRHEDNEMLEEMSDVLDKSKSDLVRRAIQFYYYHLQRDGQL